MQNRTQMHSHQDRSHQRLILRKEDSQHARKNNSKKHNSEEILAHHQRLKLTQE
jgi:hypothetical protein